MRAEHDDGYSKSAGNGAFGNRTTAPAEILTRADFAAALTGLRETAGLSVRDVARSAGIAASTAGGYFSGRHLPPVTVPRSLDALLGALGVTDPDDRATWAEALRRVRRGGGSRPAGPGPYRGLAAFEPEDAEWFFGREDLLARLRALAGAANGPVAVLGASGAGKSSLLRAGFVAGLRAAGRPVVLLTPGADPGPVETTGEPPVLVVDQFEELFTLVGDDDRAAFLARLAAHPAPVVIGLRADFYPQAIGLPWLREALEHRQLVVGPLDAEAVRRVVLGPAGRAGIEVDPALLDVLLHEFAFEPGSLPLLAHALQATLEHAGGQDPTLEHYRAVGGITRSIAVAADEVFDALGPAEQETARRMFLRMVTAPSDGAPTRRHVPLDELSGLAGTTEVRERFLAARLITAGRDTVELAHEALVTAWPRLTGWIDADRAGLRLHRALTEATRAWHEGGRDGELLYRGGRLELAAALLDGDRAEDLTRQERDFLTASLARTQAEEQQERRRTARLRRLAAALAVTLALTGGLAFYAFRLRDGATAERDAARSRQLALEAARVAVSDPPLAAQLSLAAYRISPTQQALAQLLGAAAGPVGTRLVGAGVAMQGLATHDRPDDDVLVAGVGEAGSGQVWRVDGGRIAAAHPLPSPGEVTSFTAAFAPDGRMLAVAGGGGTVRLYRVDPSGRPAPGPRTLDLPAVAGAKDPATVYALAWHPGGTALAIADSAGRVTVWDLGKSTGEVLEGAVPEGFTPSAQAVAWAPGGDRLAAGLTLAAKEGSAAQGRVVRWSFERPADAADAEPEVLPGGTGEVLSLAITRDGTEIAAGTRAGTVLRWRTADDGSDPERRPDLAGPGSWVNGVAYSPDGRTLAAASSDSSVWLWDRDVPGADPDDAPVPLGRLPVPSPATAVSFLSDGRLAGAATDGVARLWRTPAPAPGGLTQTVFGVQYAGRLLAAGGDDETRLWDVTDPERPWPAGPLLTDPDDVRRTTGAIALRADGRLLAAGNDAGSVRMWAVTDPARPVELPTLTGGQGIVQWVTIRADGRVLAQVGDDAVVRLWDVSSPERPRQTGTVELPGKLLGAAFAPDGETLAVTGQDGLVQLIDVRDPGRPRPVGAPLRGLGTTVVTAAFAPDGRTLAAAGYNRTVQLWDVTDRTRPRTLGPALRGPTNIVYGLAFSPSGTDLAAAGNDGKAWWWSVADRERPELRAALASTSSALYSVTFSADGSAITAGGRDGRVETWPTSQTAAAERICAAAGTPLSRAEWAQYAPGTDFTAPCS